jgi:hypothetical protein
MLPLVRVFSVREAWMGSVLYAACSDHVIATHLSQAATARRPQVRSVPAAACPGLWKVEPPRVL